MSTLEELKNKMEIDCLAACAATAHAVAAQHAERNAMVEAGIAEKAYLLPTATARSKAYAARNLANEVYEASTEEYFTTLYKDTK